MRARIGNRIGDNCFLKIGMVGIIIRRAQSARVGGAAAFSRGETSFTPRSRFNALKRLEATKRAVSRDYADQRLARAETQLTISFGFRFVSPRLRFDALRFANALRPVMTQEGARSLSCHQDTRRFGSMQAMSFDDARACAGRPSGSASRGIDP
jgi:hypothetical protein